ncbi:MAG TPA: VWA domain-containing protein [Acidimicrobiales bacterium]|nr:VWA domain-containing protein [Acidimicrobiales bacterium]
MKRRSGALLVMATLLVAVAGCSVGTNDDKAGDVEIDSGDGGDDTTTTTEAPADDGDNGDGDTTEEAPEGALLLIMDASGSMNELDSTGKPLIDSAKEALHGVVDSLPDGLHTGLRVFGHRYPNTDKANGCRDSELISPIDPLDREALNDAIDGYQAKGFTPIGYSLQEAAKDLPPEGPRTIILVSDGDDTCAPPDPCQIAQDLRADGVEVVVNTVGFALGDNQTARDQLTCIAEATDGQFTDVAEAGDLASTLEDVSARETRRIETRGQELTGAAIPRDAETGELDTQYVDTVVHGEVNFYRFEIEPGSRVEAEVYTAGNPNGDSDLHCMATYLVDKADTFYAYSDQGGDSASEDQIDIIEPTDVNDADEVFLKLDSSDCMGSGGNPNIQFDVELLVRVVE